MPLPPLIMEQAQRLYEYLMAWRATMLVYLPDATDIELKALAELLQAHVVTRPESSFDLMTDWRDDLLTIVQGGGGLDEMREYVGIIVNHGRASNQSLQESE